MDYLNKLKLAVNEFYLNSDSNYNLSDEEFDKLAEIYESETGNSVKTLIDWDSLGDKFESPKPLPFSKVVVADNDLKASYLRYLTREQSLNWINYKYDGASIQAIYKGGRLFRILSTPDASVGLDRTKTFWNLFPKTLADKTILSLRGEVLVDYNVYSQKSRNQANGYTNSKFLTDSVESEAFVRIYSVQFHDIEGTYDSVRVRKALDDLPVIKVTRSRPLVPKGAPEEITDTVFRAAPKLDINKLPTNPFTESEELTVFQVDGIVNYGTELILGFKYYYTESQITEVTKVQYELKPNGSYSSKLLLSPIVLNDKNISAVSTGGVPNLIRNEMGVGSKVEVILSGLTIPKVVNVVEPSEDYQFPMCGCGYQLTESDIFGSTLKCGNTELCSTRYELWIRPFRAWLWPDFKSDYLKSNSDTTLGSSDFLFKEFQNLLSMLNIDRFNVGYLFKDDHNMKSLFLEVMTHLESEDKVGLKDVLDREFYHRLSPLQKGIYDRNIGTVIQVWLGIWEMVNGIK